MKTLKTLTLICSVLLLGVPASCSKNYLDSTPSSTDTPLSHGEIVLGGKLNNPYTTENMTKALEAVCTQDVLEENFPITKAGDRLSPTHYYVRFLPLNNKEAEAVYDLGLPIYDHPLDYKIEQDGDWYHDPVIPEYDITYLYTVAPVDFDFKGLKHEVLSNCYIPEEDTKGSPVDWAEVERTAFIITGNEDCLTKASSPAYTPEGQILMSDPDFNGGKPFGVSEVKVMCNVFVKFCTTFTDRDGRYKMSKSYAKNPRYRLVFENNKGFCQGFNLIILRASVCALGTASPQGLNATITPSSDPTMYRRCAVNNAAYDYYCRCDKADMNVSLPPSDLRIWTLTPFQASSAPMAHHNTLTSMTAIKTVLGAFAPLVNFFLPDLILGISNGTSYKYIYNTVTHELSHASHFSSVGASYWNTYINYILDCLIKDGLDCYGDGNRENAGYCEVGEMWAYYLSSEMFRERYALSGPDQGSQYWFRPQILTYLSERGFSKQQIFAALQGGVTSRDALWDKLLDLYPSKRTLINQAFENYK
ncbi:MAG: hypothetical protein HUJ95_05610 [Bacteroidales bacterium]|nr:hypothetical protein [Bacteroidales bacterium]